MRDFKGFEHLIEHDYARRTDHRFHALGMRMDPGWGEIGRRHNRDRQRLPDEPRERGETGDPQEVERSGEHQPS